MPARETAFTLCRLGSPDRSLRFHIEEDYLKITVTEGAKQESFWPIPRPQARKILAWFRTYYENGLPATDSVAFKDEDSVAGRHSDALQGP